MWPETNQGLEIKKVLSETSADKWLELINDGFDSVFEMKIECKLLSHRPHPRPHICLTKESSTSSKNPFYVPAINLNETQMWTQIYFMLLRLFSVD